MEPVKLELGVIHIEPLANEMPTCDFYIRITISICDRVLLNRRGESDETR